MGVLLISLRAHQMVYEIQMHVRCSSHTGNHFPQD